MNERQQLIEEVADLQVASVLNWHGVETDKTHWMQVNEGYTTEHLEELKEYMI